MENFTPYHALTGGLLIGISASLLLWINGRIAGISGIVNGVLPPHRGDIAWRLSFLVGLVVGAGFYYMLTGDEPVSRPHFPHKLLGVAGLLVGFGTSLGSGCTSGHGVCGLARLSIRSLVATLTFVAVAVVTTYIVRHTLGIY